jgi:hypothetical protein
MAESLRQKELRMRTDRGRAPFARVESKTEECWHRSRDSAESLRDRRSIWQRAAGSCVLAGILAVALSESNPRQVTHAASRDEKAFEVSRPLLLELFTSEGCSSCPPADALLLELVENQPLGFVKLIPLAFHVDYWNWLGWRDPYSSAEFSARQRDYARRLPSGRVYTPQLIIDGAVGLVGSDRSGILAAIRSAATQPKVKIDLWADPDPDPASDSLTARIRVEPVRGWSPRESVETLVALTEDGLVSNVARGENKGRRLAHTGVVRWMTSLGELDVAGSEVLPATVRIPLPSAWVGRRLNVVVWLQERSRGPVVGSARLTVGPSQRER